LHKEDTDCSKRGQGMHYLPQNIPAKSVSAWYFIFNYRGQAGIFDQANSMHSPTGRRSIIRAAILSAILFSCVAGAEPIVILGYMIPKLMGAPIKNIRIVDFSRRPIPFQIDEVTASGEYVCPQGPEPNTADGNGLIDSTDEIVFLREDITPASPVPEELSASRFSPHRSVRLDIGDGPVTQPVYICNDASLPSWSTCYMQYDEKTEKVTTPYYFAQFGRERFHFINAGVKTPGASTYTQLTNELRIVIHLRTLFGLLPINYNEENIVCTVKRYKTGPIRLIRRGDFHLNLGLLIKGSRAAVYQICYPQCVWVPVMVHLPIRFRSVFDQAYIEMTPVIRAEGKAYAFCAPKHDIRFGLGFPDAVDTLVPVIPNNSFMRVDNGTTGYGWLLATSMPDDLLDGSGYVVRRPSERGGIAHCGYRLTLRDLPRGSYLITNWVLFSLTGLADMDGLYSSLTNPVPMSIDGNKGFCNSIQILHAITGR